MRVQDGGRVAGERRGAGHQLIQRDAERVEVACWSGVRAGDQFRGQVLGGAEHHAGRGIAGLGGQLRDAEVGQQRVIVGAEQDVGRLDVAVHDPGRVRGRQRVGDLRGQLDGVACLETPAVVAAQSVEVTAGNQVHDQGERVALDDHVV